MSRAGRSFFYFGFWVLACGLALLVAPGFLLSFAGVTMSSDIVARIFGMVLVFLGIYYFVAGRHAEFRPLFRASVYTRGSALPILALMVLILKVNPLMILFTVVDALGALWTALALRRDRTA
jgi:small neutral amino acid transporter SnatA (MarC family)